MEGVTVTPVSDDAVTFTMPVKPLSAVAETLAIFELPAVTVTCAGSTRSAKSGAAVTSTESVEVCETPVAVKVNGIEYVPVATIELATMEKLTGG